jgi:hypothetical protein
MDAYLVGLCKHLWRWLIDAGNDDDDDDQSMFVVNGDGVSWFIKLKCVQIMSNLFVAQLSYLAHHTKHYVISHLTHSIW